MSRGVPKSISTFAIGRAFRQGVLNAAYKGEILFCRLQGILFEGLRYNGEFAVLKQLRHLVRRAVDGGANLGLWTQYLLQLAAPGVEIICVEAAPENAEHLRNLFRSNPSITVIEAALGASLRGARFLPVGGKGSGAGHVVTAEQEGSIEIEQVTLESICEKARWDAIDVVKCDIEGFEMEALRGAERLFRAGRIGTMHVEYNATWIRTGHRLKELFDFASAYNYALLLATPLGLTKYPTYSEGLEDFRLRNFFLCRSDHARMLRLLEPTGRARVEWRRTTASSMVHKLSGNIRSAPLSGLKNG